MNQTLTTINHDRNSSGMTYVYPVVSRRAAGVSVGINLNPNNACNWACIYCQVPNLVRGTAPLVDMPLLEKELRQMLDQILRGDFMQTHVLDNARRLNDIALSGNGEPTSAKEFPQVVELIGRVMRDYGLAGGIKLVLITNGSLVDRPPVREGLETMARLGGEVWFKIDSATPTGMRRINQTRTTPESHFRRLAVASRLCPTWIQTCVFSQDGIPPSKDEQQAYLALIRRAIEEKLPLRGVLLYGLARPSLQPAAASLGSLSASWLESFADAIRSAGLSVKVSP